MGWSVNQQVEIGRGKRSRIWGGAFLFWVFLMFATPKIPLSNHHHHFADMRNFFGVPNTLNVITNFPFLIVGVVGFILSLQGYFFNISLRGEVWGWVLFFGGIVGVAFGSAYYHLKPDDSRVIWDTLPMMIAYSSLFSSFVVERVGQRVGLTCLFGMLFVVLLSTAYARIFNDLRLCMMFQLIPCIAIPGMTFLYPPKYTHSIYWLWAAGVYLLAKFEAAFDRKIYHANLYFISGHSLEHLCSTVIPVLFAIMLMYRNISIQRLSDLKERP
ncbi:hypothetical protein P3X46_007414 [Hevea brasiliensis]|uniref:Ceramidase n=1 Tax=Hevea brasiliensis TaxID=3981 RepID=A0ABQ9MTY8_HEVBR|nr:uncharacterized protein LOC110631771 [Hevea brasiliensis]KAJ9183581.1 hypothetical protein P3X46_007414 [Hevea brasiliensis]